MRGPAFSILAICFTLIIAVFAVSNVDSVQVNYLFGSGEAPLILVILFSVLMGALITTTAGLVKIIQLHRERKVLISENQRLKKSLSAYESTETAETDRKKSQSSINYKSDE